MIIKKSTDPDWSFFAVGLGVIFVVVTPILPLYWIEYEEYVNGSMATVLWGVQFWQPYLIIGLLVLGLILRTHSINKNNYFFLVVNLLMVVTILQMILWPDITNNPLWEVPAPIHSTHWLHYIYIPFLGIILLPLGVILSDKTKFLETTTGEFFKMLLSGIRIGGIVLIFLSIPIFLSLISQVLYQ